MSNPLVPAEAFAETAISDLFGMGAQADAARETARLEAILRPATTEQALKALNGLYRQFAVVPASTAEARAKVNQGYLIAMEGYPQWAILEASRAFVRGEIDRPDPDFMPKPARIGLELRQRVDPWRVKLGLASRQVRERAQFRQDSSGPLGPEARAYGEQVIAKLRASAAAKRRGQRQDEYVDPNPITMEMLEAAGVPNAKLREGPLRKATTPDCFPSLKR